MSTLGNKLKKLRGTKESKPTQEAVALFVGVPRATYANWEVDRAVPDPGSLVKLADYFGCSTDYLLGRDEQTIDLSEVINKKEVTYKGKPVDKERREQIRMALEKHPSAAHSKGRFPIEDGFIDVLEEALERAKIWHEQQKERDNQDK